MIANDKIKWPERVIQFGEGGFLRGFVDWILQIVNEKTDFDGSVAVVQPIAEGMCQILQEQDCVYTHIMRGIQNGVSTVEKKKVDVISRTINPYEDWQSYLQLAENPDFRIVVSNTTESGIAYDAGDKLHDDPQNSFPGKLTVLLYQFYWQKQNNIL